jgi:histidine ammonia-lyase
VVSIELLAGAEGLEFLKPLTPGKGVAKTYAAIRSLVPALDGDRPFQADIEGVTTAIRAGTFDPGEGAA